MLCRFKKNMLMWLRMQEPQSAQAIVVQQRDYQKQFLFSFLTYSLFIVFFSLSIIALGLKGASMAYVKGKLFEKQAFNDDGKAKEISDIDVITLQIDKDLESWERIFDGVGSLALIVALVCIIISVNSFSLSKKEELYHLSNQFMNFIQGMLLCIVIILIFITWKYNKFY